MPKLAVAVLVSVLVSLSLFGQNNRSAVSLTGSDSASCTVPSSNDSIGTITPFAPM